MSARPFHSMPMLFVSSLVSIVLVSLPAHAEYHPFEITEITIAFNADGTFDADLTYHVDAMLAGVTIGDPTEEDYARLRAMTPEIWERRLAEAVRFFTISARFAFDGDAAASRVTFPQIESAPAAAVRVFPGHFVRYSGAIPPGAAEFVFRPSRSLGTVNLSLIHHAVPGAVVQYLLKTNDPSPVYRLDAPAAVPGSLAVAGRFARFGFEHIVPLGLDHILFVLGLFLLSVRLAPLLWQVTAFTVAHTITLALAMLGAVSLPPRVVEPLIALSIACVAIENLFTSELKPWRPAVVFAFGLLHGMGFAGALAELSIPRGRFLSALVSFNVGVELGQLAVIALAFVLAGRFRRRPWYRARVVIPASIFIAAMGLYWTVARILA